MGDYGKTLIELLLDDDVVFALEAAAWNNGRSLLDEIAARLARVALTEKQPPDISNSQLLNMAGEITWMTMGRKS